MSGFFISLEGTEGGGKSTQIQRLALRLNAAGHRCILVREPGGTPIGEEIRHTLQHSLQNAAMTPEAELLLINASRAQLVREVIRPALEESMTVVSDRFYDSTMAYQGYGRCLDLAMVRQVIDVAVGPTRPDLTLILMVPVRVSEERRAARQQGGVTQRDRMEEADRAFFERVEAGYRALAAAEPERIVLLDATRTMDEVETAIWAAVDESLHRKGCRASAGGR